MKYVTDVKNALLEVYSHRIYFWITFFSFVAVLLVNLLIVNYSILISRFSFSLLFGLIIGSAQMLGWLSLFFLISISLLASIVLALSIFLIKRQIASSVAASASGLFVSVIAPACPSCAIGLAGMIGLGSFMAILPFKGLELGVFGIVLISVSIAYLSKKIVTKTCSVSVKKVDLTKNLNVNN